MSKEVNPFYQEDNVSIYNCSYLDFGNIHDSIVITDPPYNIGYHYGEYKDKMDEDDYYDNLSRTLGNKFVCIHYCESLFKLSFNSGIFPEKIVSWVYPSNTQRQWRAIGWFGCKPNFKLAGQPYKNPTDKRVKSLIEQGRTAKLYDWWEINQVKNVSKEKTAHPCQIPLEVMDRIIKITNPSMVVDPFMGSGTTLVACKNNGVRCIGFDIDKNYCEIAKDRIVGATK